MFDTPLESVNSLKTLVGDSVVAVKRQIFEGDLDQPDFLEAGDGITELTFASGSTVTFARLTEQMSVGVAFEKMPEQGSSYRLFDCKKSQFWVERLNKPILDVQIAKSGNADPDHPMEFAVILVLSNQLKIAIYSAEETDDSFDSLVIRSDIDLLESDFVVSGRNR